MKQIYIKDSAIDQSTCEELIDWFEKHEDDQQPGKVGSERTDGAVKISVDIPRWFRLQEWPEQVFGNALRECAVEYQQQRQHIFDKIAGMVIDDSYVMQRYRPNEGFFSLHCENTSPNYMSRTLAWMVYLNDVADGGTHFSEQDYDCEARQGRMVIWPAYFTHMHKGIVSKTTTKYIATGWATWNLGVD